MLAAAPLLALAVALAATTPAIPDDLAAAIAAMKGVKPEVLGPDAQRAKGEELNRAWDTLQKAGAKGAQALKAELARMRSAGETDDYFALGACTVLWRIGKLEEAETIASVWSGNTDLKVNYQYVFYTAFEAAKTQDPRALPMLVALLRDREGRAFQPQHALEIPFPLNHVFLWGAFGPGGLPELRKQLASADANTRAAAVLLLARAQDLESLPAIRELARAGSGPEKREAVRALGVFGHPADVDLIAQGLDGADSSSLWDFTYATYELGDLRLVPKLLKHASSSDPNLRAEVLVALLHLATPEGLKAFAKAVAASPDEQVKAMLLARLPDRWSLRRLQRASADELQALATELRDGEDARFRLGPSDRKLDHDSMLKAAEGWRKAGRITGGDYAWVEDRHVVSAATPADIPLLQSVAAACYTRLSDEALIETSTLDEIVKRLGRSRYRKEPGVCDRVEPRPD